MASAYETDDVLVPQTNWVKAVIWTVAVTILVAGCSTPFTRDSSRQAGHSSPIIRVGDPGTR